MSLMGLFTSALMVGPVRRSVHRLSSSMVAWSGVSPPRMKSLQAGEVMSTVPLPLATPSR